MQSKKAWKIRIKAIAKDTKKISIFAIVIICLALIRCICEPFRLQHYSFNTLTLLDVKPFLIGALGNALAFLTMTILSLFNKYKLIIATCILTILILFVIKGAYRAP
jgi:hypothetical protein